MTSQVSVVFSDWALTFDANQSDETCLGTIIDGENEIGFTLTWNYIETITNNSNDTSNETTDDDEKPHDDEASHKDQNSKETITGVILAIIILALLIYLLIMMRSPEYGEEE